jgi:hypothetical protein
MVFLNLIPVILLAFIHQGSGLTLQHVTMAPTKASGPQLKIHYVRDGAGLSNIRIQFETMVALAAAKQRTLIIPPRNRISLLGDFMDFDLWDPDKLANVINFTVVPTSQNWNWCPPNSFRPIGTLLCNMDVNKFPDDRDWCLGAGETRVHHFECIRGLTDAEKRVGSAAVFNGLQLQSRFIQEGKAALTKLSLKPGGYIAIHLRRTDFAIQMPHIYNHQNSTGKQIAEHIRKWFGKAMKHTPIVLASDASPEDPVYAELVSAFEANQVVKTSALTNRKPTLHNAVLDWFICSKAGTFFGSPLSTFTTSIFQLRRKIDMCNPQQPLYHDVALLHMSNNYIFNKWWTPQALEAFEATTGLGQGCWNRVTTFESMDASSQKDCSTFGLQ